VNQTHKYLIFLSMMVAPGLVWAQQVPDEEAVAQPATVDEAAEAAEAVADDEATEEVADDQPAEEPEEDAETAIGDIEVPAVETTEPTEAAVVPQAEPLTTTGAPAEAEPSQTTPPAAEVPGPTEATTVDAAAETEEPAPAEPSTTSSDTTDWSYTPRSAETGVAVDENVQTEVVPVSTSAASDSIDDAGDEQLYPKYVRIHLAGAQQFSTGNDLAAVSEGDSMGMGTFGVGVRLARHIGVELNYVSGETSDAVFADTDATFSTAGADVRARFDYALFRFFRVYGAVGVGARSASIEVSTEVDTVTQSQPGLAASLAGGVELAWIGRKFGAGAFYEGGYALQTPYNFDNARFEEGDNEGVDLGSIFLHGATHGGGLFVAAYF
jgi:hypothetical protein